MASPQRPGFLSLVVPALDEERFLPRLLARVLQAEVASDRADEVIVVDGGSRDATARVATHAGARLVRAECGRGVQLARGAREARGDVLLFLHADCVPAAGALTALRAAYDDPALVATAMHQRIDAKGWFYRAVERAANARARRGVVMGDGGLAARSAAYEAAGGFRALEVFEDVDLSRRLSKLGRVALVEGALLSVSARRWEREGVLRCTLRNWMLRSMYGIGVDPARLARMYAPHPARSETK